MQSDEHLIELYNSGNEQAFDELYSRYNTIAYNYAVRLAGSQELADDAYQAVWLKVIDKRDEFVLKIQRGDPPFMFKSYFLTMLRNAVFDKKGRRNHELFVEESFNNDDSHGDNSLESEVIAEANIANLLSVIDGLPDNQKETFLLLKEAGLSLKEVAEVQGVSIETAKTRRRYAYNRIKPILENFR